MRYGHITHGPCTAHNACMAHGMSRPGRVMWTSRLQFPTSRPSALGTRRGFQAPVHALAHGACRPRSPYSDAATVSARPAPGSLASCWCWLPSPSRAAAQPQQLSLEKRVRTVMARYSNAGQAGRDRPSYVSTHTLSLYTSVRPVLCWSGLASSSRSYLHLHACWPMVSTGPGPCMRRCSS